MVAPITPMNWAKRIRKFGSSTWTIWTATTPLGRYYVIESDRREKGIVRCGWGYFLKDESALYKLESSSSSITAFWRAWEHWGITLSKLVLEKLKAGD
ncbi:MAG TPA: hypothetical protein V6D29_09480 [Leptolyngbyaceae cyanobacterium]